MAKGIQRQCVTCGKQFTGRDRECYTCKASDRPCKICGKIFHGVKRTCERCRRIERTCACGKTFRGTKNTCPTCSPVERQCACGKRFRGTALICDQCRATEKDCRICGAAFIGYQSVCRSCRVTTRQCPSCGTSFRGDQAECRTCRTTDRGCVTCGRPFRSAFYLECGDCSGRTRRYNAQRRIRKLAAEISGPLPRKTYVAILASGPCVYCGAEATSLDHVRPISRGGEESEKNLVPACEWCNKSKAARLLIHWDSARVAHGATWSPLVAAELARELTETDNQVLSPPNGV